MEREGERGRERGEGGRDSEIERDRKGVGEVKVRENVKKGHFFLSR